MRKPKPIASNYETICFHCARSRTMRVPGKLCFTSSTQVVPADLPLRYLPTPCRVNSTSTPVIQSCFKASNSKILKRRYASN